MKNLDTSRLIRLSIAGAVAGFVAFLIFNPTMVREETAESLRFGPGFDFSAMQDEIRRRMSEALVQMTLFAGAFAALVGGLLVLADELGSPVKRLAIKLGLGIAAGAAVGAAAGFFAQLMFSHLLLMSILFLLPARVTGWAVMGAGAGAGIGMALGSWRRFGVCVLGGLIGGGIGGLLFDLVGLPTGTGTVSRFIGFTITGAAIGVAVAYVEEVAKQSWVTILSGPKEGRSYILSKAVTVIGRDELADIPLFGDPSVAKRHAYLQMSGQAVTLQSATGAPLTVNGSQTTGAQLMPWDTFSIGRFALRFHQKASKHAAMHAQLQQRMAGQTPYAPRPQPTYSPQNQTMMSGPAAPATGSITLNAVAGPHANAYFQFGPGTVRIGREAGCGILLAHDTMISRSHAEIAWTGTNWIVRDLNSTNGLWVNGVRVHEHILKIGDQIGVGQTWLRVESI